ADRSIQRIHVHILVGLNVATRRADVNIQRDWSFDIGGVVGKQLAFAFTRKIPSQANPRRQVVEEVVELDVASSTIGVSLFVVPASADVELPVLVKLPVVLDIECFRIRVSFSNKFEITHARCISDYERVAKCLGGRY